MRIEGCEWGATLYEALAVESLHLRCVWDAPCRHLSIPKHAKWGPFAQVFALLTCLHRHTEVAIAIPEVLGDSKNHRHLADHVSDCMVANRIPVISHCRILELLSQRQPRRTSLLLSLCP